MPRPSRETLDFLGQALAGLADATWRTCRRALTALATDYRRGASELAFAYGLAAAQAKHPHHRLSRNAIPGADLRSRQMAPYQRPLEPSRCAGPTCSTFSGIVLTGANLADTRFDGTDLRGADLSRAHLTRR